MKVISRPDFESWTQQQTCYGCKAVLEFGASDLKMKVVPYGYREEPANLPHITCPVCETEMAIDTAKIPTGLLKWAGLR